MLDLFSSHDCTPRSQWIFLSESWKKRSFSCNFFLSRCASQMLFRGLPITTPEQVFYIPIRLNDRSFYNVIMGHGSAPISCARFSLFSFVTLPPPPFLPLRQIIRLGEEKLTRGCPGHKNFWTRKSDDWLRGANTREQPRWMKIKESCCAKEQEKRGNTSDSSCCDHNRDTILLLAFFSLPLGVANTTVAAAQSVYRRCHWSRPLICRSFLSAEKHQTGSEKMSVCRCMRSVWCTGASSGRYRQRQTVSPNNWTYSSEK